MRWLFWLRLVEVGNDIGVVFDGLLSEVGVGGKALVDDWRLVIFYLIDKVHHFDFLKIDYNQMEIKQ